MLRAVPRPRAQALRLAALHDLPGRPRRCRGAPGSCSSSTACCSLSALIRLPEAWPWLGRRVPALQRAVGRARRAARRGARRSAGPTSCSASALGIYTGILLSTMVARPLWNSAILGPAVPVLGPVGGRRDGAPRDASALPGRPAPQGMIGGAVAAMMQPTGRRSRRRSSTVDSLIRADVVFLVDRAGADRPAARQPAHVVRRRTPRPPR